MGPRFPGTPGDRTRNRESKKARRDWKRKRLGWGDAGTAKGKTSGSRSAGSARRGPLGESTRWPELARDYTTRIFRHTPGPGDSMRDGTLRFNERISWPITPFIGTFGVAPDREVTTSIDGQGEWGGNLDIRDVTVGNRILLPIFHPGALFYLGDVHASQGDTEFTGTAAETQATVRLRLDLIKSKRTGWMRIEKPQSIVSIHANRPLEVAVETATFNLMDWLITD